MDSCPNCNQAVPLDATRCPACGLPRNLPIFDEDGSYLGTSFARPQATATPSPVTAPSLPPQGPDQQLTTTITPRRRSALMIILAVCGGAVLLGIVAAVLAYQVIYAPDRTAGRPATTATPSPAAAPPSSSAGESAEPTATPSPTPSPTPEADYPAVFEDVSSGVVQVLASTCGSTGIGSGFLVDDRTVVTSYQSVAGAVSVVVRVGTELTLATVDGGSRERGIAVLNLVDALDGHAFTLAEEWSLTVGDGYGSAGVAASEQQPSLTEGEVTDVDVDTSDEGAPMSGLVRLDGDYNAGLAGGPVLDGEGRVIGALVGTAGQQESLAVPVEALAEVVDEPSSMSAGDCQRPLGPDLPVEISGHRAADLEHYFAAINTGDYDAAYRHLGPAIRKDTSKKQAAAGWVSTYDFNIEVQKGPNGKVWVTFDSIFAEGKGPKGLICATWSLDYGVEGSGKKTVINTSVAHGDEAFKPC
ncbi:MAG: trypsin-like peptidase domain-containing protein [Propionibacteriaceae bacterium]